MSNAVVTFTLSTTFDGCVYTSGNDCSVIYESVFFGGPSMSEALTTTEFFDFLFLGGITLAEELESIICLVILLLFSKIPLLELT